MPGRATIPGTSLGGGFKGGVSTNGLLQVVCVTAVLFAMLFKDKSSILKPPPMKHPPTQVPRFGERRVRNVWLDESGTRVATPLARSSLNIETHQ